MRKHLLAIAVILTVATGCDNVAFGGIDVELKPPPVSSRGPDPVDVVEDSSTVENLAGPILMAGVRDGVRGDFVVVGEVHPRALTRFPDPDFPQDAERLAELTAPGSEWTLFSEGVRVGRVVVDEARPAPVYCTAPLQVSGVVELVPTAAAAVRMLALPAADASGRPYGEYRPIAHDYDDRVATLTIGGEAIVTNGATRPPLGVLDARDHVEAFQLRNAPGRSVAATFMHQDELAIQSPGQGAYALFVMGERRGDSYQNAYVWYRAVETEGKGAPRYFDHLDWDGDGTEEILLDVFGSDRRWFAALSRRDGAWLRTYQDPCGSGSTSGR